MSTSKIVLFDIPSKDPNHAWSVNTWKTRLVLNYKGLDYETEWLEYPEIKPRLQPHFPDKEEFTVPTIKMPDGRYIMDSWEIAEELERLHPSPALHLDSPLRRRLLDELSPAFEHLRAELVLGVPGRLLKEVNHAYWRETRTQWIGMPLEQYQREKGGAVAYEAAAPYLRRITALLRENDGGVFFLGKDISYVDFTHAGFLLMFRQLGEDIYRPTLEATGNPELHLKFLEALKPWTERDNY
ncbi:putative glutathione S-transferase [Xylaria palmicola]|nr:putative glutathione S-transferase [Xylaria palmicola]